MVNLVQAGMQKILHHVAFLSMFLLTMFFMISVKSLQASPLHASIVIDADTNQVLHELHADASRYPASLTKMMTLYILFEALEQRKLNLDTPLHVSNYAASMPPTNINLRPGDSISVREAIIALIVRSANNVATVVAEALAGDEISFGQMMTDKARRMGLRSTTFRNASGLPNNQQVTTARDMANLSVRLMKDFPQYYYYFSTPSFNFRGVTYTSHNRMVKNVYGVDGLKTGFIRASGFNIATSAKRDNRRIIVVVMGGRTAVLRDQQVSQLLEYGFNGGKPVQFAINDSMVRPATVAGKRNQKLSSASLSNSNKKTGPFRASKPITKQKSTQTKALSLTNRKNGQWGVQVGSFAQQKKARAQAKVAKKWISGSVDISEIAISNQKLYRARLIGLQESQARAGCQSLSRNGMECSVVKEDVWVN
ncbi:D-alanyl-D-alanine carboxypeptidase [Nitrosomonas sp. PY1]|uniref:D-alanyl-D-alanine carboxypeptidase n=1 Tax=Nitrosomonas sp. PY1 TaxID=1803906 RepID=UPI001FC807F4|nr:D-alanyl-D-alanine carboxypeptidase [Nitrosomonas sp. PY1]GKS70360.1 D-alanyl-D-alanine carboxypeptidase [Nitrosomonas sp. PY1]